MKNKLRILSVILTAVMLFALIGCKQKNETSSETVSVLITVGAYEAGKTAEDYDFYLSGTPEYRENQTAGNYFRALCNENNVEIKGVDDGYITEINGFENGDTFAWMFYVNGVLAEKGVKDIHPSANDEIVLSYVDWTELF